MKYILIFFLILFLGDNKSPQIDFLVLPDFFNREYEISGLTGNEDFLFLPAERCGEIFMLRKDDMSYHKTIYLYDSNFKIDIEIEGLTLYNDFLIFSDEKNAKLYTLNIVTNAISELKPNGKNISEFKGNYGIEGVVVDKGSDILYLVREKNGKKQSKIYSFDIIEDKGSLIINYKTKKIVQHANDTWRYSGLSIDYLNNRLLCLKSFYLGKHKEDKSKYAIESIPINVLTIGKSDEKVKPTEIVSLTDSIASHRKSIATNLEGIYSDNNHIYVVSDNGKGSENCNYTSKKTAMLRIKY